MVRHEHERWDGYGYPDGIAGTTIPLGSRIIFVCDAYHAITSDRPYRKAQSHETAKRILLENAGTQFDPAVVSVFLDVLDWYREERGLDMIHAPKFEDEIVVERTKEDDEKAA
jgi:HD-GYP domain-containing protein (c-di-GMP phosphodiesterase class II)